MRTAVERRATGTATETPARLPNALWLAFGLMAVPVTIYAGFGIELAPVDVLGPLLIAVLAARKPRRAALPGPPSMTIAVIAVLGAVSAVAMVAMTSIDADPIRQYASLAFTFRPLLFLILGLLLATRLGANADGVLLPLGLVGAVSCLVVALPLLWSGEVHHAYGYVAYGGAERFGEHLAGDYLGYPLYGRFGVNSLAMTYAVYVGLSLATFLMRRSCNISVGAIDLVLIGGLGAGTWLCYTSLSRQAVITCALVLGLPAFYAVLVRTFRMSHQLLILLLFVAGVAASVVVYSSAGAVLTGGASLDAFAAGRFEIATSSVQKILVNPFTGTGFLGDTLEQTRVGQFNAHNLALNLALKMGVIGAGAFLFFLLSATMPLLWRLIHDQLRGWESVVVLTWLALFFVVGMVSNSIDVTTASGPVLLLVGLLLRSPLHDHRHDDAA